jgi:hypothetical protein
MDFTPNGRKAHHWPCTAGFVRQKGNAPAGALMGHSPRFGHIAASNIQLIELPLVSASHWREHQI